MNALDRIDRSDDGFTLFEMLIAMTISMLAIGAVTTAFIVGLTTSETTTTRIAASHDAQMLSSYLAGDVLSVAPTGVDTSATAATGCNDTVVDGEDGVNSRNWLRLQWTQDILGTVTNYSASYRTQPAPDGDSWMLVRYFCSGADLSTVAPTDVVVARELEDPAVAGPSVVCSVVGTTAPCGSGVDRVSVTLTTGSGYSFSVAGGRRTPLSVPVVPSVVPDHFTLVVPPTATAGTAFSVTVTAHDELGAVLTDYTGTVHFTSTDAAATLPADTTFADSDNGVRTISGVTLKKAGTTTLSVNDTFTTSATDTANVTVLAASPAGLVWVSSTPVCSSPITVGNKGTFTSRVGLVDAYGNSALNSAAAIVTIDVTKTGSSGGSLTPASLSIPVGASETTLSFTATLPAGSGKSFVVTAQAAGQSWSTVTCEMSS